MLVAVGAFQSRAHALTGSRGVALVRGFVATRREALASQARCYARLRAASRRSGARFILLTAA